MSIAMFNNDVCKTSLCGEIIGTWCDRYGQEMGRVKLTGVAVGTTGFNLFSCTRMQQRGWSLGGDDKGIWLTKGQQTLKFDMPISTKKGVVFAVCIKRDKGEGGDNGNPKNNDEMAMVAAAPKISMEYMMAHDKLGHMGEATTRAVAKQLGWTITGVAQVCEWCAVAKAKQKAVPQVSFAEPLKINE